MTNKIIHSILFFLVLNLFTTAFAQQVPVKNWDFEKIKGTRFLPYPSYTGFPFLTDTWVPGKIELKDGVVIDSLNLRYSSFKDELVYYNPTNSSQIVIDKISLNGFSFTDKDGNIRVFRKLYYDNFGKGDRFFEVLVDGETKLLAYRKVSLETTQPYKEEKGIMKNMMYGLDYSYYFYSPQNGYTSVRMNRMSLLSKFDKVSQKPIKKLLRKYRIRVADQESFTLAWKVIEKEGYKVKF
jgi:hypothetical protein